VKYIDWDQEKNIKLLANRGVGFEDVQTAFEENRILAEVRHNNITRYPKQRVFVVEIDHYVYLVPYVEDETKIFFKTIIPSRKATKQYLKGGEQP
jgi:uncharacterized DUF497 family protein